MSTTKYPPLDCALNAKETIVDTFGGEHKAIALGIYEHRAGVSLCVPIFNHHHELCPLVFSPEGDQLMLSQETVGPALRPAFGILNRLRLHNSASLADKVTGKFTAYYDFSRKDMFVVD